MDNKILLHACCAHCTAYTVEYWRQQGYEVDVFWYNPNIHPYTEYCHRLEAEKVLAQELDFSLLISETYDMPDYFRRVTGTESHRCQHCFDLRLSKTAEITSSLNYDGFTTTLLISPHQKHDLLKQTGEKAAGIHNTTFFYADLRKRYSDSRRITKPLNLYRQQYCGCIYSEWERYRPDLKI